jgi:hypothetical protein
MYGKTAVVGVTGGTGGLASTGFGITWYVVAASVLLIGGLLLMRWGRRRGATH